MLKQLSVKTHSRSELIDITGLVQETVTGSKVKDGVCYVFVPHTTAGITINENADPDVKKDILMKLDKTIESNDRDYYHSEGNSAAHIKATITGFSQTVFVQDGQLQLGTWQNIYFAEFDGPRSRRVWVKIV